MSFINVIKCVVLSPPPNPERIRLAVMEITEGREKVGWIIVNTHDLGYGSVGVIRYPNGELHIPAFSFQLYFQTKEKVREYVESLQHMFHLFIVHKEKEQKWKESFENAYVDPSEWRFDLANL